MDKDLSDVELRRLSYSENVIFKAIEDVLGVKCNYVTDNMCEIVHEIYDSIATWGEKVKNVPEAVSYPFIDQGPHDND